MKVLNDNKNKLLLAQSIYDLFTWQYNLISLTTKCKHTFFFFNLINQLITVKSFGFAMIAFKYSIIWNCSVNKYRNAV